MSMHGLEPWVTAHPATAAFRTLTADLLAEVYLAPRMELPDLDAALSMPGQPWSRSMAVAPTETAAAVCGALRALAMATSKVSPEEIDLTGLDPQRRLYRHLEALRDLWREVLAAFHARLAAPRAVAGGQPGMAAAVWPGDAGG